MAQLLRKTRSVCPVCLQNIPASLETAEDGSICMKKSCPSHGNFSVPVWKGLMDFDTWVAGASPLGANAGLHCPENCGICGEHASGSCCVLLEVTGRCNLRCRFCFANGGETSEDPSAEDLKATIKHIAESCGHPLLQLSGGEPTLRDDLPELVRYAKSVGCAYVQVNTNGIRLAEDPDYAARLAEAGLDIAFLQFDGTKDEIYETLRGVPLLDTKLRAISVCEKLRIGVTLVPTVVPGVNTDNLGELVRLAAGLAPAVKGVHFQPVSYFGRYPAAPRSSNRYTLDMLMSDLSAQTQIPLSSFLPSRCDHPLCGFHAGFMILPDETLKPLSSVTRSPGKRSCAKDNRDYIARRWCRTDEETAEARSFSEEMDFDSFLYYLRSRSLTLTAMAFQDAMNLNIERLQSCSLHVYDHGLIKPFCSKYLSPL